MGIFRPVEPECDDPGSDALGHVRAWAKGTLCSLVLRSIMRNLARNRWLEDRALMGTRLDIFFFPAMAAANLT